MTLETTLGCEFDPGRCDIGNAVIVSYCSYHAAAMASLPGEGCDCGRCWNCIGNPDVCCQTYDLGLPCQHHPDPEAEGERAFAAHLTYLEHKSECMGPGCGCQTYPDPGDELEELSYRLTGWLSDYCDRHVPGWWDFSVSSGDLWAGGARFPDSNLPF